MSKLTQKFAAAMLIMAIALTPQVLNAFTIGGDLNSNGEVKSKVNNSDADDAFAEDEDSSVNNSGNNGGNSGGNVSNSDPDDGFGSGNSSGNGGSKGKKTVPNSDDDDAFAEPKKNNNNDDDDNDGKTTVPNSDDDDAFAEPKDTQVPNSDDDDAFDEGKNPSKPHKPGISKCNSRPYPSDIDGHWAEIYIRRLYDLCIVEGYRDGTFGPQRNISRAELVKMSIYSKGIKPNPGCYDADCGSPFMDLDMWQGPWIRPAWDLKIVQGYSRDRFAPNRPITRAEAVKVVLATYGYQPLNVSKSFFNDVNGWSVGWVEQAHQIGMVQGIGNGNFDPNRPITRAEAAKIIAKMMEYWDTKIR